MIQETQILAASNTDVMSAGRLNAIPYNGTLIVEVQSQLNDATNSFALTVQLPGGDVPVDSQIVPGTNPALAGILDERQLARYSFPVARGGHVTLSLVETGTAVCTVRTTLLP